MGSCTSKKASRLVMGRYRMHEEPGDLLGEGSSSVCHRGTDTVTGEQVAIKEYKQSAKHSRGATVPNRIMLTKFKRQVAVLQELQTPFVEPSDGRLWSQELAQMEACDLFVRLLAYSTDQSGEPGPDYRDGKLYIVTELAQYDLKHYIRQHRVACAPLPREKVHSITKAVLLAAAGLHAKGFVHLDLKPANIMMFNGRWKVIDVDGCVKIGERVSLGDCSLSFSPCYCSPEWARFVAQDEIKSMVTVACMDAWSVGMVLVELVTLTPLLKERYDSFHEFFEHRLIHFLKWLGKAKSLQLPGSIERFDADFHDLVTKWLLVRDASKRRSLAECLSCPYVASEPVYM
jgi:serine/threonine protein kinase